MPCYRFIHDRHFDAISGEVRRDGTITRLEPQPAALLALLAARPGEIVSHEEIRRAVWGDDRHVNVQDSVHYCVRQVRAALGDGARQSRFIETVPRRGYRLRADALVPVESVPAATTATEDAPPAPTSRRAPSRWGLAAACLGAAVAVSAPLIERRPNNHHQIAVTVLKVVHDLVF
jgi:DNA-binding winged helix-turn-helix (wHTH) protein